MFSHNSRSGEEDVSDYRRDGFLAVRMAGALPGSAGRADAERARQRSRARHII